MGGAAGGFDCATRLCTVKPMDSITSSSHVHSTRQYVALEGRWGNGSYTSTGNSA